MRRHLTRPTRTRTAREAAHRFAVDVLRGLSERPRALPSRYLYDARGTELFEAITTTPEYYLTRVELGILAAAAADIAAHTGPVTIVELGAGTSTKTEQLLAAFAAHHDVTRYVPVDVSRAALTVGRERIRQTHPGIEVAPIHRTWEAAFPLLRDLAPVMLVFLGSSIGNLDRTEAGTFWRRVTRHLPRGGFMLLGVDLVKDTATIDAAYNDAAGYSAEFTRNLFVRMNRELGAGLDVEAIQHEAGYDPGRQRVEIRARFTSPQTLSLAPLRRTITLAAGERILTEISRKYAVEQLRPYLESFGLRTIRVFTDPERRFAELLLQHTGG